MTESRLFYFFCTATACRTSLKLTHSVLEGIPSWSKLQTIMAWQLFPKTQQHGNSPFTAGKFPALHQPYLENVPEPGRRTFSKSFLYARSLTHLSRDPLHRFLLRKRVLGALLRTLLPHMKPSDRNVPLNANSGFSSVSSTL